MSPCNDQSTIYLKSLGFNVVRFPSSDIYPLLLLGRQNGAVRVLGNLTGLIKKSSSRIPKLTTDVACATINGQNSGTFKLGLGLNILGNLIGAMGGKLATNTNFTDAQNLAFTYEGVLEDSVFPLEIGNFLRGGEVDSDNPILAQYVQGNGDLYVINKTAKSQKFSVTFTRNDGAAANIKIPLIQNTIGANISVSSNITTASTVSFEGKLPLVFGFQCLLIGIQQGVLTLKISHPGEISFSNPTVEFEPEVLNEDGLVVLKKSSRVVEN